MAIISGITTGSGGGGGGGTITLSQDATGSGTSSIAVTVTQAQDGYLTFGSPTGLITASATATGPGIMQTAPASDLAPVALSLSAQSAYASAATHLTGANLVLVPGTGATTNGTPGNVIINFPAPTGSGTYGNFQLQEASTTYYQASYDNSSGNVTLWALNAGQASSGTNFFLQTTASTVTTLNGPSQLSLLTTGTQRMLLNSTQCQISVPTVEWTSTQASPTLTQLTPSTDVATNALTISSQSAYSGASTNTSGGNLTLTAGSITSGSTGTPGSVIASIGATTTAGTNEGYFQVQRGGSLYSAIGHYPGATNAACLWLTPAVSPSSTNYTLFCESTQTNLNAPNATGNTIVFGFGGGISQSFNNGSSKNIVSFNSSWSLALGGILNGSSTNNTGGGVGGLLVFQPITTNPSTTTTTSNAWIQYVGSAGGLHFFDGNSGIDQLQLDYNITTASVTTFTLGDLTHGINVLQKSQTSTSAASGSAGVNTSIAAQAGQSATGASHTGGAGGNLSLAGGAGGTSGSSTAGIGGVVSIASGQAWQTITINASPYTIDTNSVVSDCVILDGYTSTAASAITLPTASAGRLVIIKDSGNNAGTHNITITPASGNVDGSANIKITSNLGILRLVSDGTNWWSV